jgi:hypothetical protein
MRSFCAYNDSIHHAHQSMLIEMWNNLYDFTYLAYCAPWVAFCKSR